MINTESPFPLTSHDWNGSNGEANLSDYVTPSTGQVLKNAMPPSIRDRVWISTINQDPACLYKSQIHLINGHWMTICNNKIYCSLGGNYKDEFPGVENVTKYEIRQDPHSAVCGAYVMLFCLGSEDSGDPLIYVEPITNIVYSDSDNYLFDVVHKDIPIRIDNDSNVATAFNKQVV